MASIRVVVTLVVALTLGLALPVAAQPISGPEYIPLTPCRVFDSRSGDNPLPGGEVKNVAIGGVCGVPTGAVAAGLNFTIVDPLNSGHLTVFPTNGAAPLASLVNYVAGQTVANAADVKLGAGADIAVQPSATTDLVIDVYGYFTDVEELGNSNTALGGNALFSNTTGTDNTALGAGALQSNTSGLRNTATGARALFSNVSGGGNTAVGFSTLQNNSTGNNNTATGGNALLSNTVGIANTALGAGALQTNAAGGSNTALGAFALNKSTSGNNTALGTFALFNITTGATNIAMGFNAGSTATTGSNNIHIANVGTADDNALIRIGTGGTQTATFIAGISGVQVTGVPVMVDGNGQLGVAAASSRRVKDDIRDMEDTSGGVLKLRPVTFRYKAEPANGSRPLEYGLIAEEVAEIYPELVVLDKDGQPSGVRYHVLPAMLLNELQRQQRRLEAQQREIDELRAQVRALIKEHAAVVERSVGPEGR
jgi:Chaperone of endosialidase